MFDELTVLLDVAGVCCGCGAGDGLAVSRSFSTDFNKSSKSLFGGGGFFGGGLMSFSGSGGCGFGSGFGSGGLGLGDRNRLRFGHRLRRFGRRHRLRRFRLGRLRLGRFRRHFLFRWFGRLFFRLRRFDLLRRRIGLVAQLGDLDDHRLADLGSRGEQLRQAEDGDQKGNDMQCRRAQHAEAQFVRNALQTAAIKAMAGQRAPFRGCSTGWVTSATWGKPAAEELSP